MHGESFAWKVIHRELAERVTLTDEARVEERRWFTGDEMTEIPKVEDMSREEGGKGGRGR